MDFQVLQYIKRCVLVVSNNIRFLLFSFSCPISLLYFSSWEAFSSQPKNKQGQKEKKKEERERKDRTEKR